MEMQSYAPGTFCWTDLSSTDAAASKRFYSALFGWEMDDMPAGPGMIYTMCKLRGKDVCALSQMPPEMQKSGMPSMWTSYVSVANVDEAQQRAEAAGGKAMMPAFDVMDVGRMCLIQDPTGAVVALWQPKRHHGASLFGEPGAMVWNELMTRDTARAQEFYGKVFGWAPDPMDMGQMGVYTVFKVGERGVGGMMAMPPQAEGVPPNWGVYFAVDDCDASVAKAQGLGAQLVVPPTDIPGTGRFATMIDPQGAAFSVIKTEPM